LIFLGLQSLRQLLPTRLSLEIGQAIAQKSARALLKVLNIQIRIVGQRDPQAPILVANHLSWLDPLLLSALQPALFITSTQVEGHPFLGKITKLACCRFVSRRQESLIRELQDLGTDLQNQQTLAFFPEATTGDGTQLLPFKSSLFALATSHQCPVQCCGVRYLQLDGMPVMRQNQKRLYYYGEMTFSESLWQVLANRKTLVEIHWGQTLAPDSDRKSMAQAAFTEIQNLLD
jgi:1-acyl-sn-glycerol-3-phosphate acyltransferase